MEVSTTTFQGRPLLAPSPELNDIILGVLGRAQGKYEVDIYAFAFLSTHAHLILGVKDAKQLADFMGLLNSKVAREVCRLRGWSDKVWSRRYTLIVISGEEKAQVGRFRYVVANGCKEGLVRHVRDWPGVHVAPYLLDDQICEGIWFDRTKETCARWRGESFESRRFASRETVKLSPLPCWRHLTPEKRRKRIADMIADIEAEAALEHELSGRPPKGVQAILAQDPLRRPETLKRSPAPLFHAATKRVRRELYDAYALFLAAYREAAEKLRSGLRNVVFPIGCFPPALPFASG